MASSSGKETAGGGCIALFVLLIVVALIVMGIISLAALIDPFDWMPGVHAILEGLLGRLRAGPPLPGVLVARRRQPPLRRRRGGVRRRLPGRRRWRPR